MMYYLKNGLIRLTGAILMVLIGIVQAVGIMITAISAVVLKSISSIMLFATVLLLIFGLFTLGVAVFIRDGAILSLGNIHWIDKGEITMITDEGLRAIGNAL